MCPNLKERGMSIILRHTFPPKYCSSLLSRRNNKIGFRFGSGLTETTENYFTKTEGTNTVPYFFMKCIFLPDEILSRNLVRNRSMGDSPNQIFHSLRVKKCRSSHIKYIKFEISNISLKMQKKMSGNEGNGRMKFTTQLQLGIVVHIFFSHRQVTDRLTKKY